MRATVSRMMRSGVVVRGGRAVLRTTLHVSASVALFLVTRAFVVEMFKIPTPSMQGTLMVGDFLVVEKLGFSTEIPFTNIRLPGVRHPHVGDVIVFKWPSDPSVNFVKRVVGMPGDTLRMREGALFRNGVLQNEPYVSRISPNTDPSTDAFTWQRDYLVSTARASASASASAKALARASYWPSRNNWGPLVVPSGNYFVLGDNRDNSMDSRYWGFVPDSLVRGRPRMIYFSYVPDSASAKLESGVGRFMRLRWGRLGTIVR